MRKKLLTSLIAFVVVACSVVYAENWVFNAQDTAEMIRIKYSGSYTGTLQVYSATNIILSFDNDAGTTYIDTVGDLGDLIASINVTTNHSGEYVWQAQKWAARSSTTPSNMMVTKAAETLTKNRWTPVIAWDTSGCTNYRVTPSFMNKDEVVGGFVCTKLQGSPGGTGDVEVRIYDGDDALVWQKNITSPKYVASQYTGVAQTNTADHTVFLDEDIYVPAKTGKRILVEVSRSTTATAGGIGVRTMDRPAR